MEVKFDFDWEFSALCLSGMWPLDASLPYSGSLDNFTHLLNIVLPQGFVRGLIVGVCCFFNYLNIVKLVGMFFYSLPPNYSAFVLLTICSFSKLSSLFSILHTPLPPASSVSPSFRGSPHWGRKYLNSLSSLLYSIN